MFYYQDMYTFFINILIWWLILLLIQRVSKRSSEKKTWVQDIILTLIQSLTFLCFLLLISYFFRR